MNGRFDFIIEYLKKTQAKQFTGSIRLSFENGKLVAINEANKHDTPLSENHSNDIVNECLKMADNNLFNGTIVFAYEKGAVKSYSYQKTYKGETLKKFILER